MNLVDSSGWIEYFLGTPLGSRYSRYVEKKDRLLVPTLVLHEVYRWIRLHRDEDEALKFVSAMNEGRMIALDDTLALFAADLRVEHKLAMADSIVYATALQHDAKVITSDADFERLPQVIYFQKH